MKNRSLSEKLFHVVVSMVALALLASPVRAEYKRGTAPPVPIDEARKIIGQSAVKRTPVGFRGLSTDSCPEIAALAKGLGHDIDEVYRFVHDRIDFEINYGSKKGACATLLDKSGNAFDQASLMIALLVESGYEANFVRGKIDLTGAQVCDWFGVENNLDALLWLLGSSGIPAENVVTYDGSTLASATIEHVWVKVAIEGTDYVFDPSFKSHEIQGAIDLEAAMGYDSAAFMVQAEQGMETGANPEYVRNVNRNNIRDTLDAYATNLVAHIQSMPSTTELIDVIGGKAIVAADPTPLRQTALPYQGAVLNGDWDEIPDEYKATLRIQYSGIDETYNTCDIYGKRLTVFFDQSNRPVLYLDGDEVETGVAPGGGAAVMTLTVDQPYAAYGGTFMDETGTVSLAAGGSFFIMNSWGEIGTGILEKHRKALREAMLSGASDSSEPVLGEALAMLGFTYAAQNSLYAQIADRTADTISIQHQVAGVAGHVDGGTYVDIPVGTVSPIHAQGDEDVEIASFFNGGGFGSALEWGGIDQTQPYSAVCTVKLLDISNAKSDRIFDADASNYASVSPLLKNYSASALNFIVAHINAGYRLVLPEYGDLGEGSWSGFGFLAIAPGESGLGFLIGGGLNGGYSVTTQDVDLDRMGKSNEPLRERLLARRPSIATKSQSIHAALINMGTTSRNILARLTAMPKRLFERFFARLASGKNAKPERGKFVCPDNLAQIGEPLAVCTGDFFLKAQGPATGRGPFPLRLSLGRHYNSGRNLTDGPMGFGWRHNLDIRAENDSDGPGGLGEASAIEASSAIVQAYVATDLLRQAKTIQRLLAATISQKWIMDRLIDNRVLITGEDLDGAFRLLADGTWHPSPRFDGATLAKEGDGTWLLRTKNGDALDFNASGRVETWTEPHDETATFAYSGGKLTSVSNGLGRSLTFTYSGDRISRTTDDAGRVFQYAYAGGNLVGATDPENETTTYEYDSAHRLEQIKYPEFPSVAQLTNAYDEIGRVETQTDAASNTYTYLYTGWETKQIAPSGETYRWQFDDRGNTVGMTDALEESAAFEYDARDRLLKESYPGAVEWNYEYDGNGNLTRIVDPSGNQANLDYDDNRVVAFADELGHKTDFNRNAVGDVVEMVHPGGAKTSFAYSDRGQVASVTDASGNIESYAYDDKANLISITNGENQISRFEYDAAGNLIRRIDAMQKATSYEYDGLDRPVKTTDALGGEVSLEHSGAGLKSVTDQNGNTTSFQYDESRRLVAIQDPLGASMSFAYDANGNVRSRTDCKEEVTEYAYDPTNRLARISYQGGAETQIQYDDANRRIEISDATGDSTFSFDKLGRIVSCTNGYGLTASCTFTDAGMVESIDYPGGKTVQYAYDSRNQLASVTDWSGRQTQYLYYPNGLLRKATLPNGATIEYEYDKANRIVSVENRRQDGSDIVSFQYVLDQAGNVTSETSALKMDLDAAALEQLTYSYGGDNRFQTVSAGEVQYDANGNLLRRGNEFFQYDPDNRLVSATSAQGTVTEHVYGAGPGRAAVKRDGQERRFLYDPATRMHAIAEFDEYNEAKAYNIYGLGLIYRIDAGSGEPFFFHYDAAGHTVALTDPDGDVVNRYAYYPFGTVLKEETVENPFCYAGRYGVMDEGDGLLYMRARFYDARDGRFLSKDPIGFEGGFNLFAYVENNPVVFTDPFGLCGTQGCMEINIDPSNRLDHLKYSQVGPATGNPGHPIEDGKEDQ